MQEKNYYYVYVHRLTGTKEIFYVGKGSRYRLISKHGRSSVWHSITKSNEWYPEKYKENLTQDEALDLELELINKWNPVANIHKKDLRNKQIDEAFVLKRYRYDESSPSCLVYNEWNGQHGTKCRNEGDVAGTANGNGYLTVSVAGSNILAHRVVWLLKNKEDPEDYVIDHVDGNRTNNKISNLRKVSGAENNRNTTIRKDNSTGVVGVSRTNGDFYVATWVSDGKSFSKTISINKHGESLAFELACYVRFKNVTQEFSERHIGSFEFNILKGKTDKEINEILEDDLICTNSSGVSNIFYSEFRGAGFWSFRYKREHLKNFSVKKYGYDLAKRLAIAYKSLYLTGTFEPIDGFSFQETMLMLNDDTTISNNSGFKGIQFHVKKNGDTIIVSQKMINRKNYTKRFSCNELGLMQAHMLAIKWYSER